MRLASEVERFPYQGKTVCWVLVAPDGTVTNPTGADERRAAERAVAAGQATLYIAWPGQWSTALFLVDKGVPCRSGNTDCTADCGNCKGTGIQGGQP